MKLWNEDAARALAAEYAASHFVVTLSGELLACGETARTVVSSHLVQLVSAEEAAAAIVDDAKAKTKGR